MNALTLGMESKKLQLILHTVKSDVVIIHTNETEWLTIVLQRIQKPYT